MEKSKNYIFFIGVALVSLVSAWLLYINSNRPVVNESKKTGAVIIKDLIIDVEVVDTPEKQAQGLSGREKIPDKAGMLFYFSEYRVRDFWMKNMLFPLDIIWIDGGKVVGISKNVPIPDGESLPTYSSPSPVSMVLEVNSGFADKNNLKVGDRVDFYFK